MVWCRSSTWISTHVKRNSWIAGCRNASSNIRSPPTTQQSISFVSSRLSIEAKLCAISIASSNDRATFVLSPNSFWLSGFTAFDIRMFHRVCDRWDWSSVSSKETLPVTTTLSFVTSRKYLVSSGIFQGSFLFLPMTLFCDTAAMTPILFGDFKVLFLFC